jgi:serine protease Do
MKKIGTLVLGALLGILLYVGVNRTNIKLPAFLNNSSNNTFQSGPQVIVQEKSNVIDVVKKVSPSVVSIAIKQSPRRIFDRSPFGADSSTGTPTRESGIGTGFIVSANGVIVTNKHVVDASGQYVVITNDNQKFDVKNVTIDPMNDVAIIKVDANGLTPVEIGDSSKLELGQTLIAIGNALGEFKNTVTVGVVSGLDRTITAGDQVGSNSEKLGNVIQTDAAINPGNSGGPLLNIGGQVIGINTAVASGIAQNIGFAIPVNTVRPIINEYLATGKISRPYIGVRFQTITKRLAVLNEVPEGAFVSEAIQGGPAQKAGLQADDIITELNGTKLTEENQLTDVIRNFKVGQNIEIKYYREGAIKSAQITIGEAGE